MVIFASGGITGKIYLENVAEGQLTSYGSKWTNEL